MGKEQSDWDPWSELLRRLGSLSSSSTHLYRGCSEVSEGERSGMEREVDDRVVAMEAVVASSKDGGVQGRRSGRP